MDIGVKYLFVTTKLLILSRAKVVREFLSSVIPNTYQKFLSSLKE